MRNYLDSKIPVNLVQYLVTIGVFNNRKFTKNLQYKEISKLRFSSYLLHCRLSFHTQSFNGFIFFLLKPKVSKGFEVSAFTMFYVICIYLLSVERLCKIFSILLSGETQDAMLMKLFQSVTGT